MDSHKTDRRRYLEKGWPSVFYSPHSKTEKCGEDGLGGVGCVAYQALPGLVLTQVGEGDEGGGMKGKI